MVENVKLSNALKGNQNAAGPHGISSRGAAILNDLTKQAAILRDNMSIGIHNGLQTANAFAKSTNQRAILIRDKLVKDTNSQIHSANQKAIVVRDGLMADADKQIKRAKEGAKDFSQKIGGAVTNPGAISYRLQQKYKKGADGKSLASVAETSSMNLREMRGLKMKSEAGAKAAMDKYMAEAPPLRKLPAAPAVKPPPKAAPTAVEVYSAEAKRVKSVLAKAGGDAGRSFVKAAMGASGSSATAAQKMRDRRGYTKE